MTNPLVRGYSLTRTLMEGVAVAIYQIKIW